MEKVRVAVLRGGPSEEYDVSLKTGAAVLNGLNRERFEPLDVVITKAGEWLLNGREVYPERLLPIVDIVFLALHGTYGEDGTVQRILDRHGIRYTGSRAFPSSVAMRKHIAKERLKSFGIKMAPHMVVSDDSRRNLYKIACTITEMFGPKYVIKPVSRGSSVGVKLVKDKYMLQKELEQSLDEHGRVMVEKLIPGKEATCGVIENFRGEPLYALPPIEIVPPAHADFFDYTVKYDDTTQEICPARFSSTTKEELENIARQVHEALELSQYSRSDFIVGDDGIYFLETNTLPGLTESSLFPKAISAVGGTYQDFLTHLITDRLEHA